MKVLMMTILMMGFLVSCAHKSTTDSNGQKCKGKVCVKTSRIQGDK